MEAGSSTIVAGPRMRGTGSGNLVPGKIEGTLGRILDWLRRNLFTSISNTVLTLVVVGALAWILPALISWSLTDATIGGSAKSGCTGGGACWAFIRIRLPQVFYCHYPPEEILRVNVAGLRLVRVS